MGSHYFSLLLRKAGSSFGFHCFWELCWVFGFFMIKDKFLKMFSIPVQYEMSLELLKL